MSTLVCHITLGVKYSVHVTEDELRSVSRRLTTQCTSASPKLCKFKLASCPLQWPPGGLPVLSVCVHSPGAAGDCVGRQASLG